MFSWLKSKPKETWRLVKTYYEHVVKTTSDRTSTSNVKEHGKIFYHLFESSRGNRRVDFATTLSITGSVEDNAKALGLYQEKIFRWEMGRFDPDIPSYNEIPEEETVTALKGRVA